ILVFLDGDVVADEGLVAAHARWHHALSDAVTVGFRRHADPAGIDAAAVASAASVADLFSTRATQAPWTERLMVRTDDLTSRDDDVFRALVGANFGIRRAFYEALGGSDGSFTSYGGEDTEFAYRAYTAGGLLVPLRSATVWHLGSWGEGRAEKQRELAAQGAKLANLIAHEAFRASAPGRIYAVPSHVVTVAAAGVPAAAVAAAVDSLVARQSG
ncbi:MAG: galactosyltransferase-related protein, partial [Rhodospirillaceae bacterium]|nr:galactosyltransferase-related protein [Rhodospirillaceae bacterium]